MLQVRSFLLPSVLIYGTGSSAQAGEELGKLGLKKGLAVTDQVISRLGLMDDLLKSLAASKIEAAVYDKVATEPTVDYVNEGLDVYKKKGCEFVLAFGGGGQCH